MAHERIRAAALPAFTFVLGLATILGAWTAQIVFGYVPCHLCLEQRVPYYVGLPVVALAVIAAVAALPSWVLRILMGVAAVIFAVNVYLAVYHAGVEWNLWPGPPDCSPGGAGSIKSTTDLLNQLKNIRVVACNQASWRFLGLSFAGWNAVVSVILTLVSAYAALRGLGRSRTLPLGNRASATP